MTRKIFLVLVAALFLAAGASARSTVNKSVRVAPGETLDENLSTVNGSLTVGADADLRGDAETVNGSLTVDDRARTRNLSSVNGTVDVGQEVTVDGNVETVNGTLQIEAGSTVSGHVETVNGRIDLRGAVVERDLKTVNGSVELDQGARIKGNLVIPATRGRSGHYSTLHIELEGGSVIDGDLIVEDENRKVKVTLEDGSEVRGQIRGAEVVRR